MTNFGPTGQTIYDRTYSRTKQDGTKETWPETVQRVVDGNIALNPNHLLPYEHEQLCEMMAEFKIIPAGRHLWASGIKGRQYLFNCHVAGWTHHPTDHFRFTFLRLMEGGGVGANYSNHYLSGFPSYSNNFTLHIVCDREHPDYQTMKDAGLLSEKFVSDWDGAYEVEDSREGWADTLDDLISTYYRNDVRFSDRVYDVSRVRESGARLKTFGGSASGPLPLARMLHKVVGIMNSDEYMTREDGYVIYQHTYLTGLDAMAIDHAIAECVVSGGNRRSARMSIMHWNDPEIIAFLQIKELTGEHWTTNISVEVDDEFWKESKIPNSHAEDVLRAIVNGMGKNGEPGIWNSTKSNIGEPNPVIATNPCGEIPLEEWENCNLGHVNLAAFVNENGHLDTKGLANAHSLMTRFLMRATYGDVNDGKQRSVLARNRRIGVGHFGVASALAMMGIKYSEAAENWNFIKVIQRMADIVDMEAAEYAHNLRIPVPVKTRTVAPTGTIAKMPGVSEGIHPIYAKYFIRRIRFSDVDESQRRQVEQYAFAGYKTEPCQYAPETTVVEIPTKDILLEDVAKIHGSNIAEELVESADELTLEQMLGFQAVYQMTWADNAISYTANIDPKRYANEWEIMDIFHRYGPLLKGMTVFPEFGMAQSPYERISKNDYEYFTTGDGIDENCVNGCPIK